MGLKKKDHLKELMEKQNQQTLLINCAWNVHRIAEDVFDISSVTNWKNGSVIN